MPSIMLNNNEYGSGVRYSELTKTLSPASGDLVAILENASGTLKTATLQNAVNCTLGSADISGYGDGSVKGAIAYAAEHGGVAVTEITKAEYLANKNYYDSLDSLVVITNTGELDADQIGYDNTSSRMTATDVQAAVDELNASLTELEGKVGMPNLNYTTPLKTMGANDTYTASKECYVLGTVYPNSAGNASVTINNTQIAFAYQGQNVTAPELPIIKLNTGDTIATSNCKSPCIHVFDLMS